MRIALALLAGLVGAGIGAVLGFYVPAYACVLIARLTDTGLMAVGWIICFATIPLGAIFGAIFSFQLTWRSLTSE